MSSARHRITPLSTGAFRLDGGGMFGLIPKSMWSQWTTPDADNRIALTTRSLLVETARDGLVLVEAGYGDKWTDKERAMYALERRTAVDALGEVGVTPTDIAHVVVTHLHFDHAGGLTRVGDGGLEPVFPRARIHVQRTEWLDALANKSTMTRTYLRTHLEPIAAQVELHDGERKPLAGFTLLPTAGHTWGHQSVLVEGASTAGGAAPHLFAGDACPTVHHAHPAASLGYDMMAYEAMCTKLALLDRAEREGWTIALDHDAEHALVKVVRAAAREGGDRLSLVPVGGPRDDLGEAR
jgi:glyoxylase-like metal-dependent hydrolase (beta-lactamase superfamily II)